MSTDMLDTMGDVAEGSQEPLWRLVDGNSDVIEVNLAYSDALPFTGAVPDWRWGERTGWVRVERKDDSLYVKGRKVVLHFEPEQTKGRILGRTLLSRFVVRNSDQHIHPNVLEACKEAGILPESWKTDSQGRAQYIFAWAKGFRGSGDLLYVRCLYWDDEQWGLDYVLLDDGWGGQEPAAVIGEESLAA